MGPPGAGGGAVLGLGAGLGRRLGPGLAAAVVATAASAAGGVAGAAARGGRRRGAALQGAAWAFFAAGGALWAAVPAVTAPAFRPEAEAAAVLWVVAEVLLLASVVLSAGAPGGERRRQQERGALEGRRVRFLVVRYLGAVLAALAGFLLCLVPDLPDVRSQRVYFSLSGLCIMVAVAVTHGLGGIVMHSDGRRVSPRRRSPGTEWAFWQPWLGGWVFIICQFFGWGLFVTSLVSLAWMARAVASGFAVCFRTLGVGISALFISSQVIIGISVLHFQRGKAACLEKSPFDLLRTGSLVRLSLLLLLYTAPHLLIAAACLGGALLGVWTAPVAAGCLSAWYLRRIFSFSCAEGRAWPAFESFIDRHIDSMAEEWLGGAQVLADWRSCRRAPVRAGGGRKYVFAYHPHGLYPSGITWFHRTAQFRKLAPGLRPRPLVASVIMWVPLLSELMTWAGGRAVTKKNFRATLEMEGDVVLCPGGQAELVETPKAHTSGEIVLCTSHKGFVKLACEQGASLVPVICFGEIHGVRNMISMPKLQRFTYKRFGFPIPFLPGGRWGLPVPIPDRSAGPLTFVIGSPVAIPPNLKGQTSAPREEIDALHARYYRDVRKLFYKFRAEAGFPEANLSFSHPLTNLAAE